MSKKLYQVVTEAFLAPAVRQLDLTEETGKCEGCGGKNLKLNLDGFCGTCQKAHDKEEGLSEEEGQKPKQPTETDRLRLAQKQELIQTKQRQNSELTAAQTRDLQKKSREQLAKLNKPATNEESSVFEKVTKKKK